MARLIARHGVLAVLFTLIGQGLSEETSCHKRCERLFERSMARIDIDIDTIKDRLQTTVKSDDVKSICWKFADYDDCSRKCGSKDVESDLKVYPEREGIRRRCLRITAGSPYVKHFRCVHRFHTFLEVQCSSFAQEATKYRVMSKKAKANDSSGVTRDVLIQETCRYLHYHSMCLANAVFNYCPDADELFNRFTMRDYFLSFVIPPLDQLFTDRLLDYCQLYDFQKMAKDLFDSTKTTKKRELSPIFVTRPMAMPTATEMTRDPSQKPKKLFSSDEELMDTPPNFHYSSAKYNHHYATAFENHNFYKTTMKGQTRAPNVHGFDLFTKPMAIDISFEEEDEAVTRTPGVKDAERPFDVTWPDVAPTAISEHLAGQSRKSGSRQPNSKYGKAEVVRPWWTNPRFNLADGNAITSTQPNEVSKGDNIHPAKSPEPIEWGKSQRKPAEGSVPIGGHRPTANHEGGEAAVSHDGTKSSSNGKGVDGVKGKKTSDNDYDEYYDEAGEPLFPSAKIHITKIKDFSEEGTSSEADDFEVRFIKDRPRLKHPEGSFEEEGLLVPSDGEGHIREVMMNPSTLGPGVEVKRESADMIVFLIVAYTVFFIAALIILISLIIAMTVKRKRQNPYLTYFVKEPQMVKY